MSRPHSEWPLIWQLRRSGFRPSWLAALAVLALFTLLGMHQIDRFENTGPDLVRNGDFSAGLDEWRYRQVHGGSIEVAADGLYLRTPSPAATARIGQQISAAADEQHYRLVAESSSGRIEAGERAWMDGRITLLTCNNPQRSGCRWHTIHLASDQKQQRSELIFRIPAGDNHLYLEAGLIRSGGELQLHALHLYPVRVTPAGEAIWLFGTAAWLLFLGWTARMVLRHQHLTLPHLMVWLSALTILLGAAMPADNKQQIEAWLSGEEPPAIGEHLSAAPKQPQAPAAATAAAPAAPSIVAAPGTPPNEAPTRFSLPTQNLAKYGHFALFALLSFWVLIAFRRHRKRGLIMRLLLFATITELLQFYAIGRTPTLLDVAIDGAGIAFGLIVALPLLARLPRHTATHGHGE